MTATQITGCNAGATPVQRLVQRRGNDGSTPVQRRCNEGATLSLYKYRVGTPLRAGVPPIGRAKAATLHQQKISVLRSHACATRAKAARHQFKGGEGQKPRRTRQRTGGSKFAILQTQFSGLCILAKGGVA